ncbi:DUF2399 domain-containing protein [Paenibacillus odorifer]|uniref:TIGR02679 family protein n=1 Tax=Paenibacillus odorifer TaxID=189426 RepID=A0A1R0Y1B4_9BACL|nr:DUF2399 domain-containing protein [Paenibacillus odorifer]OMD41131.1 hypothetical protein BSK52_11920 [Paenibacillus odorifer]
MPTIAEATQYFKEERGFDRLFPLILKRYKGLQALSGTVKLKDIEPNEVNAIERFLAKPIKIVNGVATISVEKIVEEYSKTLYGHIPFLDLLESYFGKPILTNKKEREILSSVKFSFFENSYLPYKSALGDIIYDRIQSRSLGSAQVHLLYERDKSLLSSILPAVFIAISKLPLDEPVRLPLFASGINGNPHFLDLDTEAGRIFISFLQILLENNDVKSYESQPNAEEMTEILNFFGIWRDDVLNQVSCFGIRGYKSDDSSFLVLDAAAEEKTFINLPLRDVLRLKRVETYRNTVFVVENSSLFSSLVDCFIQEDNFPSILCTHGQLNLASLKLLDKLSQTADVIYYSGDHDVDGLVIAENVSRRLGHKLELWRFDAESYTSSLSDVPLRNESRLQFVTNEHLLPLKQLLQERNCAAYQERLFPEYIKDIKNALNV